MLLSKHTASLATQLQTHRTTPACLSWRSKRRSTHRTRGAERPASSEGKRVLVLGAGVAGLTSALRVLQEIPGASCTVVADKLAAHTTSHGAAGLWGPYKLSQTPEDLIYRWAEETHQHLQQLYHSPDAASAGVSVCQCHWLHDSPTQAPFWAPIVHQGHAMEERELALFNASWAQQAPPLVQGWAHKSLLCEGKWYLEWLHQRTNDLGGHVLISPRPLESLQQLCQQDGWQPAPAPAHQHQKHHHQQQQQQSVGSSGRDNSSTTSSNSSSSSGMSVPFDAVVDCCGLGARDLLADKEVHPIRGQVLRVHAPWVRAAYMCGDTYIIPNRETVVLGGTGQVDDYTLEGREHEKAEIWRRCCALMPSLEQAQIVTDWVGLRPGRTSVRLETEMVELEECTDAGPEGGVPVVHNYGHGGAGLTLAWGCAGDVARELSRALSK